MHPTGVMFFTDQLVGPDFIEYAKRCESLGYQTVWLPELFGREPFSAAGYLLAHTEVLAVASGIANIYARDPLATRAAADTLGELSGGRFRLGLGVSNPGINQVRGHRWLPPAQKLRDYLVALAATKVYAPRPPQAVPTFLAAHGPLLLAIAAERTDGAMTYLMSVAHTARAREALGPTPTLNVVQHCLLEDDPDIARSLARRAVGRYVGLDYYQRAWSALGFQDSDFENDGSDRLIDTLVAWGNADAISQRLDAQRAHGATEVVVIPLNPRSGSHEPDWSLLEALAS